MDEKKYIVNNTATISCEWVIRASYTLKYPLLLNFYTKKREGKPRKEKPNWDQTGMNRLTRAT